MSANTRSAAMGNVSDFYEEVGRGYGKVFAHMVIGRVCYEALHECPLCEMSAITKGPAHPIVECPNCGVDMMVAARKDEK